MTNGKWLLQARMPLSPQRLRSAPRMTKLRIYAGLILSMLNCVALLGQSTGEVAPGAPGNDAHWPGAAKVGFGTSNTVRSKVWFTLTDGVMTEVYYPRLDVPNTQCLQLIVCTKTGCLTEADDTNHAVRVVNSRSLSFRQINTARTGAYTITKSYVTDPERASILIQVSIEGTTAEDRVYLYFDPSLNNSGMHDSGWSTDDALLAADANIATALISNGGLSERTNGYLGTSDGLVQLRNERRIVSGYTRANNGNVVQVARIRRPRNFTIALGFGMNTDQALTTARRSLAKGFSRVRREYESGWLKYLKPLRAAAPPYQKQFNIAAMVLKALEDKTYRGAMIASPSTPWGGGPNANEATVSGYHAVWARDLYHVATAFLALGDNASANRALDYLFNVQQKADGSFPQNSWIDGRPIGGGLQMDQVAFPLVLAYQLKRSQRNTWLKHIKPAADFIVRYGPATGQDRWEEKPGYSPATIAAEIAGLVCAARIAEISGDAETAASYRKVADDWAATVDRWTATTTAPDGVGHHYLRITESGNPDEGAKIEINSGGGTFDQREIIDSGFLELVRLGIKNADDPLILRSLNLVDKLIKVNTPVGAGWYRYNHDAYGERLDGRGYDGRTGVGRLWTLLTGERGEFELTRGDQTAARNLLGVMSRFANDGLMLCEQIWDGQGAGSGPPGSGTGSATPLAWSMAQFIRLAVNIQTRRNVETPEVVAARYRKRSPSK